MGGDIVGDGRDIGCEGIDAVAEECDGGGGGDGEDEPHDGRDEGECDIAGELVGAGEALRAGDGGECAVDADDGAEQPEHGRDAGDEREGVGPAVEAGDLFAPGFFERGLEFERAEG